MAVDKPKSNKEDKKFSALNILKSITEDNKKKDNKKKKNKKKQRRRE